MWRQKNEAGKVTEVEQTAEIDDSHDMPLFLEEDLAS